MKKLRVQDLTPRVAAVSAALLLGGIVSWYVMFGGRSGPGRSSPELLERGARVFDAQCALCHGASADWPMAARVKGRSRDEFYALLDHLPAVNPVMPGFSGSDADRRALAAYLFSLSRSPRLAP